MRASDAFDENAPLPPSAVAALECLDAKARLMLWLSRYFLVAFALTLPLAVLHPAQQGLLGFPRWFLTASYLVAAVYCWRSWRVSARPSLADTWRR